MLTTFILYFRLIYLPFQSSSLFTNRVFLQCHLHYHLDIYHLAEIQDMMLRIHIVILTWKSGGRDKVLQQKRSAG